jgi:hypothetical protein
LVFAQIDNLDLWEFLLRIFDEVAEYRFVVVSDDAYFLDVRYLCDGGETVPDNGMASDFEEGLCWSS